MWICCESERERRAVYARRGKICLQGGGKSSFCACIFSLSAVYILCRKGLAAAAATKYKASMKKRREPSPNYTLITLCAPFIRAVNYTENYFSRAGEFCKFRRSQNQLSSSQSSLHCNLVF